MTAGAPDPAIVAGAWAAVVLVFPTAGVAVVGGVATAAATVAVALRRGRSDG